jgi:phasin
MKQDKSTFADAGAMMSQGMEQARGLAESYLRFLESSMSTLPWAHTELSRKILSHAERNVMSAFEYAQKLTSAKDLKEITQLQTEFLQKQIAALGDQAKELRETVSNEAGNVFKSALKQPS